MPMTPSAGVPPQSTLAGSMMVGLEQRFEHFPTPYFIAPGLTQRNFYQQNGLIILASIVSVMLMVLFFFMTGSASASYIGSEPGFYPTSLKTIGY